jgi:hypothetical protein
MCLVRERVGDGREGGMACFDLGRGFLTLGSNADEAATNDGEVGDRKASLGRAVAGSQRVMSKEDNAGGRIEGFGGR